LHLIVHPGAVRRNPGCMSLNSTASMKLWPDNNVAKKSHWRFPMEHLPTPVMSVVVFAVLRLDLSAISLLT